MPLAFVLVALIAGFLLVASLSLTVRALRKSGEASQEYAQKVPEIVRQTKSGHVVTFGHRPSQLDTGKFPSLPREERQQT